MMSQDDSPLAPRFPVPPCQLSLLILFLTRRVFPGLCFFLSPLKSTLTNSNQLELCSRFKPELYSGCQRHLEVAFIQTLWSNGTALLVVVTKDKLSQFSSYWQIQYCHESVLITAILNIVNWVMVSSPLNLVFFQCQSKIYKLLTNCYLLSAFCK